MIEAGSDVASRAWPAQVHSLFRQHGLRQIAYVPDAGLKTLIELCQADPDMAALPLTTEEEGVALLAGAWLGGAKGALLLQSSGVGNCINMLSLAANGRFPLFMLITMRGEFQEFNPWQLPMARATRPTLEAMGVRVTRADAEEAVADAVAAGLTAAYEDEAAVALLLGQRLIGRKVW